MPEVRWLIETGDYWLLSHNTLLSEFFSRLPPPIHIAQYEHLKINQAVKMRGMVLQTFLSMASSHVFCYGTLPYS